VLKKHRGICHFFVGKLDPADLPTGAAEEMAESLAAAAISTYVSLVKRAISAHPSTTVTEADQQQQLEYHTLYLFQVLMLDRGTTHGILAHSDNDVGTLGSIPMAVGDILFVRFRFPLWVLVCCSPVPSLLLGASLRLGVRFFVDPHSESRCEQFLPRAWKKTIRWTDICWSSGQILCLASSSR
jgi:hypothetical protein